MTSRMLHAVTFLQYADHTLFFPSPTYTKSAVRVLEKDAIEIMDWFKNNKKMVNASNIKLVCFRYP